MKVFTKTITANCHEFLSGTALDQQCQTACRRQCMVDPTTSLSNCLQRKWRGTATCDDDGTRHCDMATAVCLNAKLAFLFIFEIFLNSNFVSSGLQLQHRRSLHVSVSTKQALNRTIIWKRSLHNHHLVFIVFS